IPIHLGAIGPKLTALAGELDLGLMTHPTNSSSRFLRERALPALERGAAHSGRPREAFELIVNPPLALGATRDAVAQQRERQRELLAILLSTPNYGPSLELFGRSELGPRLRGLVRAGEWDRLASELDDALLDSFVSAARYEELASLLREQYRGL